MTEQLGAPRGRRQLAKADDVAATAGRMTQQIMLSGVNGMRLRDTLWQKLIQHQPRVVGIAAAFVSIQGVLQVVKMFQRCGEPMCLLVAGTDHAITHPEALFTARRLGWKIRLGSSVGGIFHPKVVVAGNSVTREGSMGNLCCVYVGSSNLTNGGLGTNVECGFVADTDGCPPSAADVFAELWRTANPAGQAELTNYAALFAERARRRSVAELADLGVSDAKSVPSRPVELRLQQPPARPALGADFALAAWTGLQSFTGEYRFQVEFPRAAGKVISQLIGARGHGDGRIDVYIPEDATTRPMQYKFYQDNSMFRLNVPNDVPGVAWVRDNRDGVALVERGPQGGAPLRLRILKPGREVSELVGRSAALGTWGKTTTRVYGWY